jgi:cyclophilin family peptidyl-prolyl cis-trans isomerase/HEAT repeat protein
MGQTGNERGEPYLIEAFQDTSQVNTATNESILEAIGKIGSEESLRFISRVTSYKPSDTLLLLGQSKALYRFALRDLTTREGTATMVKYVTENVYPLEVQQWAANYLGRAKDIDISDYQFQLANTLMRHDDPYVRMALALSLKSSADPDILTTLLSILNTEQDYRVKCNIIRALGNFEYITVVEKILELLRDPNSKVSSLAADYLIQNGKAGDALIYRDYISDELHWLTRAKVYQAINRHLPRGYKNSRFALNSKMKEIMSKSENPYERVAVMQAIAEDPTSYKYVIEQGLTDAHPAVKTESVVALAKIFKNEDFARIYYTGEKRVKSEIIEAMRTFVASGDVGMIYGAAEFFTTKDIGLKTYVDDVQFLSEAQQNLEIPKDIETYKSLQKAIDYLENNPPGDEIIPDYNHPIPFDILKSISDTTIAVVKTSKGNIVLDLLEKEAPGSVANFVKLAREGFFDKKNFHRVVPNFVIQGGCPRGDGFGSLNYTIRSELYKSHYMGEGFVGMASAGNHTECSQWFITHSPTPHLDGNYSIFAKVLQGMDVVHAIDQGDLIQTVRIK